MLSFERVGAAMPKTILDMGFFMADVWRLALIAHRIC
jgi:hypothetical protein